MINGWRFLERTTGERMIKIENWAVSGFEHAIRGMRNPMNSWERSDSEFDGTIEIGQNDHALMMNLAKGGAVHAKYRRMINVYADITAPLYWWSEYDTYKVGTVANSCSKMHKLLYKEFETNDFSFDKMTGYRKITKHFRPEILEENEIWKKIDDEYEVSNMGRVRHNDVILNGSVHKDNYILTTVHGKQIPIHRLVANKFIPNHDNKPEVNHIDGNKMNNKAENLEWVTRSENQQHAVNNHLQPNQTTTYKGKFTAKQREEIKEFFETGKFSKRQLAQKYKVSHTCICDVINNKYEYKHRTNSFKEIAKPTVDMLNKLRDDYYSCDEANEKKQIWYTILQLLPESYNQKRTVMLNYEVLTNIYISRKNHKLDEWREFCDWIEKLPCSEVITG